MLDVIAELIAVHVMGWKKKRLPNNDEGLPYYAFFWVDKQGKKVHPVNFFSPASSIFTDVFELIEHCRKHSCFISLVPNTNGYDAIAKTPNGEYRASADTAPMTIALAALKAFGVEYTENPS